FFSSRRRHTRSKRDWSSDVCSSDLSSPRRRPTVEVTTETHTVIFRTGCLSAESDGADAGPGESVPAGLAVRLAGLMRQVSQADARVPSRADGRALHRETKKSASAITSPAPRKVMTG